MTFASHNGAVKEPTGGPWTNESVHLRSMGVRSRVLVVDDEASLRQVIVRNLEMRGYEVVGAGTAMEALDALGTGEFDLMLLDINLPDLTGWEVLRRLAPEVQKCVPTVVFSASPLAPRRVEEFRPAGMLLKPFPMDALLRLVAEVTGGVTKEIEHA